MDNNKTITASLRMTPDAKRKLLILARWKMTTISWLVTQLIEAEWVNYQIQTNGGHDDRPEQS